MQSCVQNITTVRFVTYLIYMSQDNFILVVNMDSDSTWR